MNLYQFLTTPIDPTPPTPAYMRHLQLCAVPVEVWGPTQACMVGEPMERLDARLEVVRRNVQAAFG